MSSVGLALSVLLLSAAAPPAETALIPASPRAPARVAWIADRDAFLVVEWVLDDETGQQHLIAHLVAAIERDDDDLCALPAGRGAAAALRACIADNRWGTPRPLTGGARGYTIVGREVRRAGRALGALDDPDDFTAKLVDVVESPSGRAILVRYRLVLEGATFPQLQSRAIAL